MSKYPFSLFEPDKNFVYDYKIRKGKKSDFISVLRDYLGYL